MTLYSPGVMLRFDAAQTAHVSPYTLRVFAASRLASRAAERMSVHRFPLFGEIA